MCQLQREVGDNFGWTQLQEAKEGTGLVPSQSDLKVYQNSPSQGQQCKMCLWTNVRDKFIHMGVGSRVR
jgi:hypothetical protein